MNRWDYNEIAAWIDNQFETFGGVANIYVNIVITLSEMNFTFL